MTFIEMLRARWQKANSMVCVGLDTDYEQIPESLRRGVSVFEAMKNFNISIVSATRDFVCAYKPNISFYEAEWLEGLRALQETVAYIRYVAPDIPIILDAKRTDIGNTNKGYVKMAFDVLKADAITVNPYFGGEALGPFLERTDKGIIILCRTSNKGAKEFQDLVDKDVNVPLYQIVARQAALEWNKKGNCLLVVGATYPNELKKVRAIVGDNMPILVPGIGAQKGDLEGTVAAGLDSQGFGMIINSARGIIFASKGEDFAEVAAREARKLRDQINEIKTRLIEGERVKKIFVSTAAVITGSHIVYTSGKHGSDYVNKDAVYPHTEKTDELCQIIARRFQGMNVEVVVAPAVGGVILSEGVARHLTKMTGREVLGVYAEKTEDGESMIIKRGYDKFIPGKRVLIVDDVLTTGGSVKKLVELVKSLNGTVVGVGALCNRGNVQPADLGDVPVLDALTEVQMATYEEVECPLCAQDVPINTELGKGREFLAKKEKEKV